MPLLRGENSFTFTITVSGHRRCPGFCLTRLAETGPASKRRWTECPRDPTPRQHGKSHRLGRADTCRPLSLLAVSTLRHGAHASGAEGRAGRPAPAGLGQHLSPEAAAWASTRCFHSRAGKTQGFISLRQKRNLELQEAGNCCKCGLSSRSVPSCPPLSIT